MRYLRSRLAAALLVCACAAARPALAQAAAPPAAPVPPGTPIAAAQKTILALKEWRLEDFTASMHPEALAAFRSMLIVVVEGAEKQGKGAELLPLFAGAADLEAVKRMSEAEFYVSFLRGALEKADLKDTLKQSNHRILGHVLEGPVAHVVYRMSIRAGDQDIVLPAVISVKKSGDTWAALLTGEVEGMAQILLRRFSDPKGGDPLTELKLKPEILGDVRQGKTNAWVVVRWSLSSGPARFTKLAATPLTPKDEGWKLLMKGDRAALQRHLEKNYAPL